MPRKTLKYEDYLPLNALWNQYMEEQLGSDMESLSKRLDPTNSGYECLRYKLTILTDVGNLLNEYIF